MDGNFAIERHRVPLLGHVMGLVVMIGLTEGTTVERVPKSVYRYVLGILRTAESAVRRLIIAAARDIVVEPRQPRPAKPRPKISGKVEGKSQDGTKPKPKRKRGFLFNLFDPPKRLKKFFGGRPKRPQAKPPIQIVEVGPDPRIPMFLVFRQAEPPPAPPAPVVEEKVDDGTVNARHLCRRLFAVVAALQDIPGQAMRYARWRDTPIEDRHPQRESALRFGRPPGFRKRPIHEVDEILKECHWLARNAEPQLDTS